MATFWLDSEEREEASLILEQQEQQGDAHDLLVRARQACAKVPSGPADYELCIRDVLESQNLGLADLWSLPASTLSNTNQQQEQHQQQLVVQARVACATISGTGFEACLQDVLTTQNLQLATLWNQAQDRERQQLLRGGKSEWKWWW